MAKKYKENKMGANEYVVKNENLKQTEITFSNFELPKNAVIDFAYANYSGSFIKMIFLGEIYNDFRALIVIIDTIDEYDDVELWNIDLGLSKLDTEFSFGVFDITNRIPKAKTAYLLKLDQNKILHITLESISDDRFNGGYFAKGKLIGTNSDDFKFIGVTGDIKNEELISSLNLNELIVSLPELSEENYFHIREFIEI